MEWTQIEIKWAAMARRVRADVPCTQQDETAKLGYQWRQYQITTTGVAKAGAASSHESAPNRDPQNRDPVTIS